MKKYILVLMVMLLDNFAFAAETINNNPFVNVENNSTNQIIEQANNIDKDIFLGLDEISITGVMLSSSEKILLIQYPNGSSSIVSLNEKINEHLAVHKIHLEYAEFADLNSDNIFRLDFRGVVKNINEESSND
jgi:hypothetical protein